MKKPTCRWCAKGYERMELDADGTRTEVSRRLGIMGHAQDEYFWPCEMDYPRPRTGSREGYRDPFEVLRERERVGEHQAFPARILTTDEGMAIGSATETSSVSTPKATKGTR